MANCDYRNAMDIELQYLRKEMETNRKYVFERPVLIVTAGAAASGTLSDVVGFEFVPAAFLALMIFNLWFTFNRLISTSRIIAYLQLVHRRSLEHRWIGWEAALHEFRSVSRIEEPKQRPKPNRTGTKSGKRGMRFYGPIYAFHVSFGLGVSLLLAFAAHGETAPSRTALMPVWLFWTVTLAAMLFFVGAAYTLRPGRIRHSIENDRDTWMRVPSIGSDNAT